MTAEEAEQVPVGALVRCEYMGKKCGMVIKRFHSPVTGDRCFLILIDNGVMIQSHHSWCEVYKP